MRNGETEADLSRRRFWAAKAQAVTLPAAERHGCEYTEADHTVMSDPTTTVLAKALAMKRTYHATSRAVSEFGYTSARFLGDAISDQWLIDNPNAGHVDEITASLNQPRELVPAGRPDFEWDE